MPKRKGHSPELKTKVALEALNKVISKFGPPEIMNNDQGNQLTTFAWTDQLR